MKNFVKQLKKWNLQTISFDVVMLVFRIVLSLELIIVHGIKKIGIGTTIAEVVPNPLHLPANLNQMFAIVANLFLPFFIMIGWCTRWATLPILAVTLMGYFVVHGNDSLLERDIPFMYSLSFLMIFCLGPGKYSFDKMLQP
ncbi:putative oxidoreductase [Flavobacterium sp. 7E]|uniref:DoxX family protein n=1 Tax=Flavobacterium sp. 7E TaxID=2735898 RepID=UPI00156E7777|nr:DoxX family protein [Flavobacterium sp. 7E]NRS87801.1 putative oxidoreductase [Flavobacterium sp. 7E]